MADWPRAFRGEARSFLSPFAFRLPNGYHAAGTRHNVARRAICGAVAPDEEEQERWQE